MDNVKIIKSKNKVYIKKGSLKFSILKKYYFFVILLSVILYLFLNSILNIEENIILFIFEYFLMTIYFIFFISLFLHTIPFFYNLYLENILIEKKGIKISSISYFIEIDFNLLKEIKISLEEKFFISRPTITEFFRNKCIITFITKDEKEYKWGYSLSYQKGMEIKNLIEERIEKEKVSKEIDKKIQKATGVYNLPLNERYQQILKKIIEEEKFYISQIGERIIINGSETAIENLEIFKNMEWKEKNFYTFYVNFLSKKENADKAVEVAYNGEDSKRVKVSELREDINRIRYPQDYEN